MLLLKLLLVLRLIFMANFLKTACALRKIGANNQREIGGKIGALCFFRVGGPELILISVA